MEQLETSPVMYGILGLLAFAGPLSGYDIKQLFDHMLSAMWVAAQSQIYKELRRMKELGWVEMEREEQEARPDRKVYSITEKGYAALKAWQAQTPEVFQLRDEMLLKLLFGSFAVPAELAQTVRNAIAAHEMRLLAYRQNRILLPARGSLQKNKRPNPYAREDEGDPYFRLVTRFAIEFEQVYIRWLYEALEDIEGRQRQLPLHEDETSEE